MKVSKDWLKELIDLKVPFEKAQRLLPLRTIATKEITENFIELDMKGYNRTDLLSLRGVAYEVAAIVDSKVRFDELTSDQYFWVNKSLNHLDVEIKDPELCPVYCLAKIENIKVEQSSSLWVKKLNDSGIRAVNNIADVTNLVMLEYGQPLHAFDADIVKDQKIIIRTAEEGEKLVTLDNKTRELSKNDLLIADVEKALGLAGVMGGKNSEISDSTTTILLEAAIFEPRTLRKTATRLSLQSEASKRFYHGLSKKRLLQAFNAAIRMYEDMGGKVTAITMNGELEDLQKKVTLRLSKAISLIGVELTDAQVEDYLKKLNFSVSDKVIEDNEISWVIIPPYYRLDIEIEEDLIEEVARMYGYEKITPKALQGEVGKRVDQSLFNLINSLKTNLVDLGLIEVQTYSFFSTAVLSALGFNDQTKKSLVKIANPISAETEYMRLNIWPNLLEAVAKNSKQGFEDIVIFEVGKVYESKTNGKPLETYRLSLALMNGSDNPIVELNSIMRKLDGKLDLGIKYGGEVTDQTAKILYHPNRTQEYKKNDRMIGSIAEIHPRVTNQFGLEKRVAVLEIDLDPLL